MTFTDYVERQKRLIISRRTQTWADEKERDSESIFRELDSLKGLNTAERMRYAKTTR